MKLRDLLESPVAVLGDWGGFKDKKSTHIAGRAFKKGIYEIVGETEYQGKPVKIAKKDNSFYMGTFGLEYSGEPDEREVFVVLIEALTFPRKDIKAVFKYKTPIQIKKVETTGEKMRGVGAAFYQWFINEGYSVVSDMIQFDGARALYSKLSKSSRIKADIIDDYEGIVIKENTKIEQGFDDWDFDEEVWSYDFKKANIKIVLTKI